MPLILIGLDAGEITIIERLISEGRLPAMARLWHQGTRAGLQPRLGIFEGMNWDRWLEGRDVSRRYHYKVWRPDRMGFGLAWTKEYRPRQPFWQDIAAAGARVGVMDMPFAGTHLQPDVAWNLKGWQSATDATPMSVPGSIMAQTEREFGRPTMQEEIYGRQTGPGLLRLRSETIAAAEQGGRIAAKALARERFDLFAIVFGSVHRAGHYLWDTSQIDRTELSRDELRLLEGALDEVYVATDHAIGQMLDAAGSDSRVIIFATYGMSKDDGWVHHLPAMIDRIAADGTAPEDAKTTLLGRIKSQVPIETLMAAGRKLPYELREKIVLNVSPHLRDWSKNRFLAAPGEPHGFVRINLRGRELKGAVEPGNEYEDLCRFLEKALHSFVDRRTGLPIVEKVVRVDDLLSDDVPERASLPDLVVEFTRQAIAQASDGITSTRFGEIRWDKGQPNISGRAGNHVKTAWYCAWGPGFAPCSEPGTFDTIDMAPSIIRMMGMKPDERFDGKEIPALTASVPTEKGAALVH